MEWNGGGLFLGGLRPLLLPMLVVLYSLCWIVLNNFSKDTIFLAKMDSWLIAQWLSLFL